MYSTSGDTPSSLGRYKLSRLMCWSSYNFSQYLWHTTNGLNKKFPIKTCGVSDDLSGDMLAPSWPNLVVILFLMQNSSDLFSAILFGDFYPILLHFLAIFFIMGYNNTVYIKYWIVLIQFENVLILTLLIQLLLCRESWNVFLHLYISQFWGRKVTETLLPLWS